MNQWYHFFRRSWEPFEGKRAYQVRLLKEHGYWMFWCVFVMAFPLWYLSSYKTATLWTFAAVGLLLIFVHLLHRIHMQVVAIRLYVCSFLLMIGILVCQTGGARSTDAFFFVPIMAVAGLLLDTIECVVILTFIGLFLGFLWWIEKGQASLFSSGFFLADVLVCCVLTLLAVRLAVRSLFGSLVTLNHELAQRHAVEQQLIDGKNHLSAIYEALSDAVLLVEPVGGLILEANKSSEQLFGRVGDGFFGLIVSDLFSGEDRLISRVILQGLASGLCSEEVDVTTRTGRRLPIEIICTRISPARDSSVLLVVRDITAQRRRLREKLWYESIVSQMREDIVYTDRKGTILYVNPSFERITGYSKEECVGKRPSLLKSGVHDAAFYSGLWTTISSGGTWSGVFVNRTKDGRLIHQDTIISPIMAADGCISGYLAIKRDITEKLELERRYVQAQKMEAIGTLAGGVAHDFNNILCSIIGFTELAKIDAAGAHDLGDKLDHVLDASLRARDLVNRILTFSRHQKQVLKPVAVVEVIQEVINLLKPALTSSVSVRSELALNLPPVLIDPSQLHQVILNLATNAGHAMRAKASAFLVLRARLQDAPSHVSIGAPALKHGRTLLVEVEDNGHGMTQEVVSRIFEPFFTTKPQGEGTGLGLSVVHGIVKDAGGAILVSSKVGEGTLFQLYFPVITAGTETAVPQPDYRFVGKQQRVLFIDDEEFICSLMQRNLTSYGLRVTVKSDPRDAIALIRTEGPFDLVISDLTMPGMSGLELARELWALHPKTPFILSSGLIDAEARAEIENLGIRFILPKPFTAASVAVALSQCLEGELS